MTTAESFEMERLLIGVCKSTKIQIRLHGFHKDVEFQIDKQNIQAMDFQVDLDLPPRVWTRSSGHRDMPDAASSCHLSCPYGTSGPPLPDGPQPLPRRFEVLAGEPDQGTGNGSARSFPRGTNAATVLML